MPRNYIPLKNIRPPRTLPNLQDDGSSWRIFMEYLGIKQIAENVTTHSESVSVKAELQPIEKPLIAESATSSSASIPAEKESQPVKPSGRNRNMRRALARHARNESLALEVLPLYYLALNHLDLANAELSESEEVAAPVEEYLLATGTTPDLSEAETQTEAEAAQNVVSASSGASLSSGLYVVNQRALQGLSRLKAWREKNSRSPLSSAAEMAFVRAIAHWPKFLNEFSCATRQGYVDAARIEGIISKLFAHEQLEVFCRIHALYFLLILPSYELQFFHGIYDFSHISIDLLREFALCIDSAGFDIEKEWHLALLLQDEDYFNHMLRFPLKPPLFLSAGATWLHMASQDGWVYAISQLCTPYLVNAKDGFGYTPLLLAVMFSKLDAVIFLLSRGAAMVARNNNGEGVTELIQRHVSLDKAPSFCSFFQAYNNTLAKMQMSPHVIRFLSRP